MTMEDLQELSTNASIVWYFLCELGKLLSLSEPYHLETHGFCYCDFAMFPLQGPVRYMNIHEHICADWHISQCVCDEGSALFQAHAATEQIQGGEEECPHPSSTGRHPKALQCCSGCGRKDGWQGGKAGTPTSTTQRTGSTGGSSQTTAASGATGNGAPRHSEVMGHPDTQVMGYPDTAGNGVPSHSAGNRGSQSTSR